PGADGPVHPLARPRTGTGVRAGDRAPRRPGRAGRRTPLTRSGRGPRRASHGPPPHPDTAPDPHETTAENGRNAMSDTERQVHATARRAKEAAAELAPLGREAKDAALHAVADALVAEAASIVEANAEDVQRARRAGEPGAMVDRLTLTEERVAAIAGAVREVAELPDPVGEVVRGSVLPNGLELRQVRVPMGVIGIIYEARPNVTADAAGLCLKSGNAVLLRGSSSARTSNAAIVATLRAAAESVGLPADAVQLVDATSRDSVKELMRARGLVDVLIPRGGADLIRSAVEESTVPVIETGVGNC